MAILKDRQDKAIAINLLGRKVLIFDATGAYKSELSNGDYHIEYPYRRREAGKANTIRKSSRYGNMKNHCTLSRVTSTREVDQWRGSGDWFYLSSNCACLTADDHYTDYIEFAEFANAPIIEEGDKCSILVFDRNTGETEVHTVIAREVNGEYSTAAHFEEEPEEETMAAIRREKRR